MSIETLNSCVVCHSDSVSEYLQCLDHFVSSEPFTISICNNCGFCFTNPRPIENDAGRYYDSAAYISHSKTSRGFTNRLFHLARIYTILSKKKIVKKYSSGNQLLDYGCGTGEFLNAMNKAGWVTKGLEPNDAARNEAISSYSLDIMNEDDLNLIHDESLDAITLWHVLEHVYPLNDRLSSFYKKLKPDGTLFVALPNMKSHDAIKYGGYWAAYDVPRHIYHFNPETAIALMSNFGFSHIATKPMPLDAFYISMLSEKYMNGSPKNIRAMISGLRSNLTAYFGKRNYSSLIYIFKKSK